MPDARVNATHDSEAVADLDEARNRRNAKIGAYRAWLHLSDARLVSADTARILGLSARDIARLRRSSSRWAS